jgi:hypothetical protein
MGRTQKSEARAETDAEAPGENAGVHIPAECNQWLQEDGTEAEQ